MTTTITRLQAFREMLLGKAQPAKIEHKPVPAVLDSNWGIYGASQQNTQAQNYFSAQNAYAQQANQMQNRIGLAQLQMQNTAQLQSIYASIPTRFGTYRKNKMPMLQERGYQFFLACKVAEFEDHEEWVHGNCEEPSIAHCDTWQLEDYPRAFANKADAALFSIAFECTTIPATDEE